MFVTVNTFSSEFTNPSFSAIILIVISPSGKLSDEIFSSLFTVNVIVVSLPSFVLPVTITTITASSILVLSQIVPTLISSPGFNVPPSLSSSLPFITGLGVNCLRLISATIGSLSSNKSSDLVHPMTLIVVLPDFEGSMPISFK